MTDQSTDGSEETPPGEETPPDEENAAGGDGLIEAFLSTYERYRTRKSYGHDLRDFFGQEEVTPEEAKAQGQKDIEEYLDQVASETGETAARRRQAALRSFYKWALKEEMVSEEAAKEIGKVELPSEEEGGGGTGS